MAPLSWRPPDDGVIKVNTDAAVDSMNGKIGIGIIIRGSKGEVLAYSAQTISVGFSSEIMESLAVFRGLVFACDSSLLPCTIETDAHVVVNLINSGSVPLSDIGLIIHDIAQVLVCFPSCKVVFAFRLIWLLTA
ncbi:hypothetical protein Dsin_018209 [Dipteronia sinensis]|uniref:RNase H type-1 domain-containing protein n=1 Tax=Dipteronia sinensis TaxID=43782 RepID=A0AAE0E1P2_9ROSI|nr:hypothetical protein Dsin_018209 [Dipteronia sinensis]